jgi:hypothetical protein
MAVAPTTELRQSDVTLEVAPTTSILDAMIAADAFVSYDCKRRECGNCFAQVLAGQAVRRDVCLTPQQRVEGVTPYVSRAKGKNSSSSFDRWLEPVKYPSNCPTTEVAHGFAIKHQQRAGPTGPGQ